MVDPGRTFCICLLPSPFLTEMTRPFAGLMSVVLARDGWQGAQSGNLLTLPHFRGARARKMQIGINNNSRVLQLQIQQILSVLGSRDLPSQSLCTQIPNSAQYLASGCWGARKESHESVSVSDSVAVGPR